MLSLIALTSDVSFFHSIILLVVFVVADCIYSVTCTLPIHGLGSTVVVVFVVFIVACYCSVVV